MIRLLKYTGAKIKFIDQINIEINKTNCSAYIEPFCGSAAIFLNLEKQFRHYIISDIDKYVIKIFETFRNITFDQLNRFYNKNIQTFGNWGENKDSFYAFRQYCNKKYFNSNSEEEGMFLYFMNKSCLNSIFRVGKNGCTCTFGNRGRSLILNEDQFLQIQHKLKNTTIQQCDFFEFHNQTYISLDNERTLLFLDPPYSKTNHAYQGKATAEFNCDRFLNLIRYYKSKIIYTDLYDKKIDKLLNWRVVKLGNLVSIRPHKSSGTYRGEQVMYINF